MLSSQHRLVTQPAIRAYEAFSAPGFGFNSKLLDDAFGGSGLKRGYISEVCGAPGMGKTSLALQITANALLSGSRVIWVETCQPIPMERLRQLLDNHVPSSQDEEEKCDTDELLNLLDVVYAPNLVNILAFLRNFDQEKHLKEIGLLIIDNLSMPIQLAYPTSPEDYAYLRLRRNTSKKSSLSDSSQKENTLTLNKENEFSSKDDSNFAFHNSSTKTTINRRKKAIGTISSLLSKITSSCYVAIFVTTQMTSKVVSGIGAKLIPLLSTNWLDNLSYRLILYSRHSTEESKDGQSRPSHQLLRYAFMAKQPPAHSAESELAFQLTSTGIQDYQSIPTNSSQRRKRSILECES
ncbi:DNA recombination mediator, RecA family ATPase Rad55/Rhp55 [Schizosaccharomyces pombe]|uniref:DNA repair protein rhp55 n=1 Tax=Schizosaccharomyces pombe (strain 972 / ATCC 24843) TaxID=284812 RepID=RAD55_SCHPO|nr:RecA family ATPase Rhp55 [Schizosaccharomyces pombe]O14129.1 RecName: Full=DNA repair protein rhp55; AltName: Full=RAD55 homolog [Schizosaccharomyces pombe 972h-]AAC17871.1 recombinational DNA repair protein Rhp55p [Schizosaccharomyces pombe]CAB16734.1 RecA family ATPase Rhp55 [Schizosaccharomyces pombe]|eukprot:NP_593604.1 RecA family ATPase Rhp55 [Schizosaccharomyces pombe]